MAITADKKDYKNGYKKHYYTLKKIADLASINSKSLLLAYSVECGLKYLILDKWAMNIPKNLTKHQQTVLYSHNLEVLLKELGQCGTFHFSRFRTIHDELVDTERFHEVYRYCIGIHKNDIDKQRQTENELQKVAEWIEKGL